MTSMPTSSRKNTTMRMPTMAPVPRPEPPSVASEGQRQGEGIYKQNRQEREARRGVRREKGVQQEGEGTERKLEREEGDDEE